ncbi:hypothetical protein P8V03_07165 [Clostridium sp. A1-XYC3]|uniref:Uncharacterized protein n=1 Tax=Clostridium tanneri TaxID=3037988 RepID=A0ABU4JSI3_9CLOT|nr:hypothetical protein [Clostridium sp. A1-XYC3]MDW8800931.1 hypothetical protein [Clostridium sp. A1-XYC3]
MKSGIRSDNKDLKGEKLDFDTVLSNNKKDQKKAAKSKPDEKYPWDY